jgi:hypothetical protein
MPLPALLPGLKTFRLAKTPTCLYSLLFKNISVCSKGKYLPEFIFFAFSSDRLFLLWLARLSPLPFQPRLLFECTETRKWQACALARHLHPQARQLTKRHGYYSGKCTCKTGWLSSAQVLYEDIGSTWCEWESHLWYLIGVRKLIGAALTCLMSL